MNSKYTTIDRLEQSLEDDFKSININLAEETGYILILFNSLRAAYNFKILFSFKSLIYEKIINQVEKDHNNERAYITRRLNVLERPSSNIDNITLSKHDAIDI